MLIVFCKSFVAMEVSEITLSDDHLHELNYGHGKLSLNNER